MCNTNCCCKPKEEDLLCCCMPLPMCCGGCCGGCCNGCVEKCCDDCCKSDCCECDCCYCKYYRLLNELREQLNKDEEKIAALQGDDNRIETKVDNYYTGLVNLITKLSNDLSTEINQRIDDVNAEEGRAKDAENDLLAYITRVDNREHDDHIEQKQYIDNRINYLLGNTEAGIDSFVEILNWLGTPENSGVLGEIATSIANEAAARAGEDNSLRNRILALETLTGKTSNNHATLAPGNNNIQIAQVNGTNITVDVPALPTHLPNPNSLYVSVGTNQYSYDGSARLDISIPTKVSDLTNDSSYATTGQIPTKVSQLTNDSGYATTAQAVGSITFSPSTGDLTIKSVSGATLQTIHLLWKESGTTLTPVTSGRSATASGFYDSTVS